MFILTVHKCLVTLRRDKLADLPIITLFLRDGIVWFIVVSCMSFIPLSAPISIATIITLILLLLRSGADLIFCWLIIVFYGSELIIWVTARASLTQILVMYVLSSHPTSFLVSQLINARYLQSSLACVFYIFASQKIIDIHRRLYSLISSRMLLQTRALYAPVVSDYEQAAQYEAQPDEEEEEQEYVRLLSPLRAGWRELR
jgi:hypothetical protein